MKNNINKHIISQRQTVKRIISAAILVAFIFTTVIPPSYAQVMNPAAIGGEASPTSLVGGLPQPGSMVDLTPAFMPTLIKGLKVHPENPLLFDFILDTGKSGIGVNTPEFKSESEKLIKYFLASMTIKESDLWVNLSPYEKNRIATDELGKTELGRDMLAQDYILKQLTASLMYPEKEIGKDFWNKVYAEAKQKFGTTDIPTDTFNKVWIVADKAKIFEHNDAAYVVGAHLKVMLEEDYEALKASAESRATARDLAASHNVGAGFPRPDHKGRGNRAPTAIIKKIIIPAIEKEVNEGKNFATLRQMFYSMILATWYKQALKDALLNQVYSDKAKIGGVTNNDPNIKEKIYAQYLEAFKKGAYNYIKEEYDPTTQQVTPKKYFSGGLEIGVGKVLARQAIQTPETDNAMKPNGDMAMVTTKLDKNIDRAMTSMERREFLSALGGLVTAGAVLGGGGFLVYKGVRAVDKIAKQEEEKFSKEWNEFVKTPEGLRIQKMVDAYWAEIKMPYYRGIPDLKEYRGKLAAATIITDKKITTLVDAFRYTSSAISMLGTPLLDDKLSTRMAMVSVSSGKDIGLFVKAYQYIDDKNTNSTLGLHQESMVDIAVAAVTTGKDTQAFLNAYRFMKSYDKFRAASGESSAVQRAITAVTTGKDLEAFAKAFEYMTNYNNVGTNINDELAAQMAVAVVATDKAPEALAKAFRYIKNTGLSDELAAQMAVVAVTTGKDPEAFAKAFRYSKDNVPPDFLISDEIAAELAVVAVTTGKDIADFVMVFQYMKGYENGTSPLSDELATRMAIAAILSGKNKKAFVEAFKYLQDGENQLFYLNDEGRVQMAIASVVTGKNIKAFATAYRYVNDQVGSHGILDDGLLIVRMVIVGMAPEFFNKDLTGVDSLNESLGPVAGSILGAVFLGMPVLGAILGGGSLGGAAIGYLIAGPIGALLGAILLADDYKERPDNWSDLANLHALQKVTASPATRSVNADKAMGAELSDHAMVTPGLNSYFNYSEKLKISGGDLETLAQKFALYLDKVVNNKYRKMPYRYLPDQWQKRLNGINEFLLRTPLYQGKLQDGSPIYQYMIVPLFNLNGVKSIGAMIEPGDGRSSPHHYIYLGIEPYLLSVEDPKILINAVLDQIKVNQNDSSSYKAWRNYYTQGLLSEVEEADKAMTADREKDATTEVLTQEDLNELIRLIDEHDDIRFDTSNAVKAIELRQPEIVTRFERDLDENRRWLAQAVVEGLLNNKEWARKAVAEHGLMNQSNFREILDSALDMRKVEALKVYLWNRQWFVDVVVQEVKASPKGAQDFLYKLLEDNNHGDNCFWAWEAVLALAREGNAWAKDTLFSWAKSYSTSSYYSPEDLAIKMARQIILMEAYAGQSWVGDLKDVSDVIKNEKAPEHPILRERSEGISPTIFESFMAPELHISPEESEYYFKALGVTKASYNVLQKAINKTMPDAINKAMSEEREKATKIQRWQNKISKKKALEFENTIKKRAMKDVGIQAQVMKEVMNHSSLAVIMIARQNIEDYAQKDNRGNERGFGDYVGGHYGGGYREGNSDEGSRTSSGDSGWSITGLGGLLNPANPLSPLSPLNMMDLAMTADANLTETDVVRVAGNEGSFEAEYHEKPTVVVLAPGRANGDGEHVDYPTFRIYTSPDGSATIIPHNYSAPIAIQNNILISAKPRTDNKIVAWAKDYKTRYEFDLNDLEKLTKSDSLKGDKFWANYLLGAYQIAKNQGRSFKGAEFVIEGNVPTSGGVSSSSAYSVALSIAFSQMFGWNLHNSKVGKVELALFARDAERSELVGSSCGYLDQLASIFGKKDHITLIDYGEVPVFLEKLEKGLATDADVDRLIQNISMKPVLDKGYKFMLFNSNVERPAGGLGATNYNVRADYELPEGGRILSALLGTAWAPHVSAYTLADLERVKSQWPTGDYTYVDKRDGKTYTVSYATIFKRVRYVLGEKERTLAFIAAAKVGDVEAMMRALNATGDGLMMDGDFQISAYVDKDGNVLDDTLDILVKVLRENGAAARMMGGGGGGSVILLVKKEFDTPEWRQKIIDEVKLRSKTHKVVSVIGDVIASEGARVVKESPDKAMVAETQVETFFDLPVDIENVGDILNDILQEKGKKSWTGLAKEALNQPQKEKKSSAFSLLYIQRRDGRRESIPLSSNFLIRMALKKVISKILDKYASRHEKRRFHIAVYKEPGENGYFDLVIVPQEPFVFPEPQVLNFMRNTFVTKWLDENGNRLLFIDSLKYNLKKAKAPRADHPEEIVSFIQKTFDGRVPVKLNESNNFVFGDENLSLEVNSDSYAKDFSPKLESAIEQALEAHREFESISGLLTYSDNAMLTHRFTSFLTKPFLLMALASTLGAAPSLNDLNLKKQVNPLEQLSNEDLRRQTNLRKDANIFFEVARRASQYKDSSSYDLLNKEALEYPGAIVALDTIANSGQYFAEDAKNTLEMLSIEHYKKILLLPFQLISEEAKEEYIYGLGILVSYDNLDAYQFLMGHEIFLKNLAARSIVYQYHQRHPKAPWMIYFNNNSAKIDSTTKSDKAMMSGNALTPFGILVFLASYFNLPSNSYASGSGGGVVNAPLTVTTGQTTSSVDMSRTKHFILKQKTASALIGGGEKIVSQLIKLALRNDIAMSELIVIAGEKNNPEAEAAKKFLDTINFQMIRNAQDPTADKRAQDKNFKKILSLLAGYGRADALTNLYFSARANDLYSLSLIENLAYQGNHTAFTTLTWLITKYSQLAAVVALRGMSFAPDNKFTNKGIKSDAIEFLNNNEALIEKIESTPPQSQSAIDKAMTTEKSKDLLDVLQQIGTLKENDVDTFVNLYPPDQQLDIRNLIKRARNVSTFGVSYILQEVEKSLKTEEERSEFELKLRGVLEAAHEIQKENFIRTSNGVDLKNVDILKIDAAAEERIQLILKIIANPLDPRREDTLNRLFIAPMETVYLLKEARIWDADHQTHVETAIRNALLSIKSIFPIIANPRHPRNQDALNFLRESYLRKKTDEILKLAQEWDIAVPGYHVEQKIAEAFKLKNKADQKTDSAMTAKVVADVWNLAKEMPYSFVSPYNKISLSRPHGFTNAYPQAVTRFSEDQKTFYIRFSGSAPGLDLESDATYLIEKMREILPSDYELAFYVPSNISKEASHQTLEISVKAPADQAMTTELNTTTPVFRADAVKQQASFNYGVGIYSYPSALAKVKYFKGLDERLRPLWQALKNIAQDFPDAVDVPELGELHFTMTSRPTDIHGRPFKENPSILIQPFTPEELAKYMQEAKEALNIANPNPFSSQQLKGSLTRIPAGVIYWTIDKGSPFDTWVNSLRQGFNNSAWSIYEPGTKNFFKVTMTLFRIKNKNLPDTVLNEIDARAAKVIAEFAPEGNLSFQGPFYLNDVEVGQGFYVNWQPVNVERISLQTTPTKETAWAKGDQKALEYFRQLQTGEVKELAIERIARGPEFGLSAHRALQEWYKQGMPKNISETTDKAMATPGGIDLNAKNLDMNVSKEGNGIEIKFDPAMVEQFKRGDFSGIVPVIIRITPIESPFPLLGLEVPREKAIEVSKKS
ncbi:MAG: hypothetical protein HQL24_04715 [Candidatus Omnitrophica bacterium]|nr:hypothetical protein [Candidatus Omnitrophota bacterium]